MWLIETLDLGQCIIGNFVSIDKSVQKVFSSFSPDVCICLSLKQSTYPVYQLVNGDTGYWLERMDSRVRKVGMASSNAKFWNMDGVVSLVDEFLQNQGLIFNILTYRIIFRIILTH